MEAITPLQVKRRKNIFVGFIDPGGTIDDYFLTLTQTNVQTKEIYVTGAMHWLLNDKTGVTFAKIRNDIAKLHLVNHFDLLGCEFNNMGRSEVQSMRREYHIPMYGVNTSGRVTSEETIRKQRTLDKHQMVRWTNSWRQDGLIKFPKRKTPEIKKILSQLDTFIVEKPNLGGTPNYKYHAEGTQHDDGVMSLLGNLYLVKEKYLKISGFDQRHIGAKRTQQDIPNVYEEEEQMKPVGRSMGTVDTDQAYRYL